MIQTYGDRTIAIGEDVITHVLVSRRPGASARSVTLIAASHGQAIQRIAQLLTNEAELKELFEVSQLVSRKELPNEFQLLFEVHTIAQERGTGTYRLIKCWLPQDV